MKRSSSFDSLSMSVTPPSSPLDQFDTTPQMDKNPLLIPPSTSSDSSPSLKKQKKESKSAKRPKVMVKKENKDASSGGGGGTSGQWNGEKRGVFTDEVIAAGYKALDLDAMASKLGLSKRQLIDQLTPNKSNMRGKAVKAVKGE